MDFAYLGFGSACLGQGDLEFTVSMFGVWGAPLRCAIYRSAEPAACELFLVLT